MGSDDSGCAPRLGSLMAHREPLFLALGAEHAHNDFPA